VLPVGRYKRLTKARVKRITLFAGIALVTVLAVVAWKQPLRPKGDYPQATLSGALNWFFSPFEVNQWYRPPVWGYALRAVTVVPGTNGRTVVAVGDDGVILRTEDGGEHWRTQISPLKARWNAVSFADAKHGWVAGFFGPESVNALVATAIISTTDGGTNWTQLPDPLVLFTGNVNFLDARNGWAVVSDYPPTDAFGSLKGDVAHTRDGGATWEQGLTGLKNIDVTGKVPAWSSWVGYMHWVAVGFFDPQHGCAANITGLIACTADGGTSWRWALMPPDWVPESGPGTELRGITFSGQGSGWAVGKVGLILYSNDMGRDWIRQPSGTNADFSDAAFADAQIGWVVGWQGTILHTTNAGATWRPQESAPYRRYPAPWFFVAMALSIPLFMWATSSEIRHKTIVDDIISADAPVESLENDRLGQRALVERLTNFLTNPNTAPPLVISLQAPWGMGKSSVMRMLQANLKKNRAAVTVWFNAWHHQKEDQLLAYLLETVQRQAVPQWLSRTGVSFRLDLIRVRLFDKARRDRLVVVLAAIGFVALRVAMPELFPAVGWGSWLTKAGYVAVAGVFLRLTTSFKSNPEKLTENAGGFLVDTFKEAVRLPSLVGKADVREEFGENLKDVAEALKPQRLVIFLDDLDRCRPEQVVQILEAINFLSSVAPVFVIVGAHYTKVETLVANQFADLALREAENVRGNTSATAQDLDPIQLRVGYAQDYLKKIVNIRLNLKAPQAENFREMMDKPRSVERNSGMFARYGRVLATLAAPAVLAVAVSLLIARTKTASPQEPLSTVRGQASGNAASGMQTGNVSGIGRVTNDGAGTGSNSANAKPDPIGGKFSEAAPELGDGRIWRNGMLIGIPALLGLLALIAILARPANLDQAEDDPKFKDALVDHTEAIFKLYQSPRELRRLLNYLRLVAARTGQEKTDEGQKLRAEYSDFDKLLVGLAVRKESAGPRVPKKIQEYYEGQCAIFGLDPSTFEPKENRGSSLEPSA
jgi:photosystem II stability/assembly factor-like uncharacterized protein